MIDLFRSRAFPRWLVRGTCVLVLLVGALVASYAVWYDCAVPFGFDTRTSCGWLILVLDPPQPTTTQVLYIERP